MHGQVLLVFLAGVTLNIGSAEPQFGSITESIFKPAINFINVLTGSDSLQSNYQSQPDYNSYTQSSNNKPTSNNYQSNANNYQQQPSNQVSSSCQRFWSYQNDYENWGLLTIPNPDYVKNVLKISLSLAAQLPSRYVGEIELVKEKQSTVQDVLNGSPILYRVKFPIQNPLPSPTEIYLNDQLLCSGPKETGRYITTITLDHTFLTGLSSSNRPQRPLAATRRPEPLTYAPPPAYEPPAYVAPQTTRRPVKQTPQPSYNNADQDRFGGGSDFECGVPDYRAPTSTGLVLGGQLANRGQFPWLAAYYHNGRGDSGFICGGSLISTKLVVTAAHCVQAKKDPTVRKAEEASFYMGKYNLESLNGEKNFIVSGVSQLIIHNNWNFNDDKYDADIAIAVLLRTVPFSKFVKPICIWTSSSSFNDLVGKKGVVAGWGKTEISAISTDRPKWTEIPVVDSLTCIRSSVAFNPLTSDRTFCAGNREGTNGPCNGDSGGGFVVNSGNRWYLRGIVSASLLDRSLGTCDTKNYAVFTDTAKFTSWMQGHIQRHG